MCILRESNQCRKGVAVSMRRGSLSANRLKIIAVLAMVLDHVVALFVPHSSVWRSVLRCVGLIAAPTMCYMIAEGYHRTSNRTKYFCRLALFALISHIPYNLCMGFSLSPLAATSVMWSLAMGLLALIIVKEGKYHWVVRLVGLGLCCLLAYTANWNYIAVLWIVVFGVFHGQKKLQMLGFAAVGAVFHLGQQFGPLLLGQVPLEEFDNWYQFGIFLAIPLLLCYDGTRGHKSKWISRCFYWFYPAHLLVLYVLEKFVL